ncbi:MAG: hypothetical protein OEW17_10535 [Gemmatimonadota bacterium]|nr:hypothetical protein [Gemmatimonadota bacterium]MDH4349235.1 hypothetical protein [Gemmatimonadota bacterium]MDH5283630.1 hypothetical protein [Gemmatimonadota bacterium]
MLKQARLIVMLAAAPALATAACGDSTTVPGGSGGGANSNELVLTIGQEVRVDSLLRLAATGVPQDSRCPLQAMCVWAGDGAVAIAYGLGMGPSYPDTLHTTLHPHSTNFSGYVITLVDLMPYPQRPGSIPADEYAVRLRVERLPD